MTVILSIFALGVIILIHEFGHFLFAKLFKVGVIEFSLGLGPTFLSFVKGETRYSLKVLPFGGACAMLGEEDEESADKGREAKDTENSEASGEAGTLEDARGPAHAGGDGETLVKQDSADSVMIDGRRFPLSGQFVRKPAWQRALIIFGGPLFNFILAFLLSVVVVGVNGFFLPVIHEVEPDMPAAKAGIAPGDTLTGIRIGRKKANIVTTEDLAIFLFMNSDLMDGTHEAQIRYLSGDDNTERTVSLYPAFRKDEGVYRFGFTYSYDKREPEGIRELLRYSFHNLWTTVLSTVQSLEMLFSGKVSSDEVMGPVGMVAVMDETVDAAADYGFKSALLTLFEMMLLISGSLGATNLLPLPALDGGRLVFIILEMILGHPVNRKAENRVHYVGLLLLLALMLLIMAKDILRLITG